MSVNRNENDTVEITDKAKVKRPLSWLALIVLFAALLRLAVFAGYEAGDDRRYIANSFELSQGRFVPDGQHWQARLAMLVPQAILYNVFGANITTSVVLPFFWSLACVVLAYVSAQVFYKDSRTALLCALFVAVFPLDVIKSTQYFPAMALSALTCISFISFRVAQRAPKNSILFFLSGVTLGLAYLHRFTAMFLALPIIALVVFRRRWQNGYLVFAMGMILVLAGELLVFNYLYDDPFRRIGVVMEHGINTTGDNEQNLQKQNHVDTQPMVEGNRADEKPTRAKTGPRKRKHLVPISTARMVYRPILCMAFNQEFGLFYYAIVAALIGLFRRRDGPSLEIALWFGLVAGYTLWGTVKLSSYEPLFTWPRYMSVATIPGLLLLSRWIVLWQRPAWKISVVAILVASSFVCIYLDNARSKFTVNVQLVEFCKAHPGEKFVFAEHAFQDTFIANGFQKLPNASILGLERIGTARRFDPSIQPHLDESLLAECYVVIPLDRTRPVPADWRSVATIVSARRWFIYPLRSAGGVFRRISAKLGRRTGFTIYYAPGK